MKNIVITYRWRLRLLAVSISAQDNIASPTIMISFFIRLLANISINYPIYKKGHLCGPFKYKLFPDYLTNTVGSSPFLEALITNVCLH